MEQEDLNKQEMVVKGLNYIKYDSIPDNFESLTKVRYKHQGEQADPEKYGQGNKSLVS